MDIIIVPLRLTLEAYVELNLFITKVTIFEGLMWEFAFPTIKKRILTLELGDKDKADPTFAKDNLPVGKRAAVGGCEVIQLRNRSADDPAFQINVAADSETSKLVYEYKVGDYPGK